MSNKYTTNEKSRNENTNLDENHQQTAEPSCLYEIKNISKEMINVTKTEMDSIVQLLHSIHEEIRKKFANSQLLNKIEEIFDKNLELILNYFIRCFQHTDTVKISITNNIINGLSNIQNSARILTDQYLNQEKINDFQKSSNFFMEEEFVKLINSLSTSIKEFMKNCNSVLKIINSTADSLSDQLSSSKNTISDLLNQINNNNLLLQNSNQMKYSQKQGGTQPTTKDKIFKDKISSLSDKLDILVSLKANLAKNLKFVDNYCSKFYDDSKGIFKQLKTLHTEKLSGLINQNQEYNENAENLIKNAKSDGNVNVNVNDKKNNYDDENCNVDIQKENLNDNCILNCENDNKNNNDFANNNYDENLFKFSQNNFTSSANANINTNTNINNNYINLKTAQQKLIQNSVVIGNNNNFNNERENNFKSTSSTKNYNSNYLINNNNKSTSANSKGKSLNSYNNKSLNSSQLGLSNNPNLTPNNNSLNQNISPINRRHVSTNFNYNTNINDIHSNVHREHRTNSNPKPFSKNSLLNNSLGKMNALKLNVNSSTPSNFSNYNNNNNFISQTTKHANLNKSAGSFNRNKKKINNLSLGNCVSNNNNHSNNNTNNNFGLISENEAALMLRKNEDLNIKIKELLKEINSLQISYKKLAQENIALKNFSSSGYSSFSLNNQIASASNKNAKNKDIKRNKSNENTFNNNKSKNSSYIENTNNNNNHNLIASNNLCANCQGAVLNLNNNNNDKKSNLNSNSRKLSGELNSYVMNSEPNENNFNQNNNNNFNNNKNNANPNYNKNLNTSGNSFLNNNMNASASEKFYVRKNYKEKLIELYSLSEKVLMFIELMQKLQEEISFKSDYVKELKILFEETKQELIKIANESYNKAKIDLEKELNSNCSLSNALDLSPSKMLVNGNKALNNANKNSSKNLISANSKSRMNVKAGVAVGNKKTYNSTILNYVNKKVDSNNLGSYYSQNENTNISNNNTSTNNNYTSNNINTEENNALANSSHMRNSTNTKNNSESKSGTNKKKNLIKGNIQNLKTDNINNNNNKITSKIMQENQTAHVHTNNNQEDDSQNIQADNYENYEESNQKEMHLLNNELEENLKNISEENNYLKELNENLIKELNELRELSQNLENENHEKANLIEELNEKVLQINQKLVDSVAEFNYQQSENLMKIEEQESKINEMLNELNITKLTNQALYAEINRRQNNERSCGNNEQEENGEDLNECNNNNNIKEENENANNNNENNNNSENNENYVFNSLNNRDEDEKYILNVEIEKQISENIQSKQLIESLNKELEKLKSKYESISKESKQALEANKSMKNLNADLEKAVSLLKTEFEKSNKEFTSKENSIIKKLNLKLEEIQSLEISIEELKSKEKSDKAEINKLNAALIELDKQLSNSKNSANELQIKIKVSKNEKDALAQALEKIKTENAELKNQITQMQENLNSFESQKSAFDLRYINLETDYNTLFNDAEQLKKEKSQIIKTNAEIERKYENLLSEKNNFEASNKKLSNELSEFKNTFRLENDKVLKNKNLLSKIEDLESEINKQSAGLNSKEIEIKLLNKKNEELRSEIKSLSKASDNYALELNNLKRTEENLKSEIKNLLKSEENLKAEIKTLQKKDENSIEDAKKLKAELNEKTNKINIQKNEIERLVCSKDELNAKVKTFIDNEGLLKLENESLLKLEDKLRAEVKGHIGKEHNLKEQNKILLHGEEKLNTEIKSLVKEIENKNKEIFDRNDNNNKEEAEEEEKLVEVLKVKMNELENDNQKLREENDCFKSEVAKLIEFNEKVKKEKEDLEAKFTAADKALKAVRQEKDNYRSEAENLKVLTEDYDLKCERISELENKIWKLKQEKNNANAMKEEVEKLNKLVSQEAQRIQLLEGENAKLQKENEELNNSIKATKAELETLKNNNIETDINDNNNKSGKNYEDLESEKNNLDKKLASLNLEIETEIENKKKLKSLNETQLNYLLKFSDKLIEINNYALDTIENINAKFSQSDYIYQIPILDFSEEINFSDLKETFQRIRSNNISESYNAIINFFSCFFEAKVLKIPETINKNIINIESKFIKVYEDLQAKLAIFSKTEKDLKNATQKNKNSEIEKVNLATLLEGKEQECEQLMYKLSDTEKKYKNYRESQKSNSEKTESKIENLEKENKKLLEAISNLQAELELNLDENEKLKNEKDKLGNLENIGFGKFLNSNNLLNSIKNENTNCNRDLKNNFNDVEVKNNNENFYYENNSNNNNNNNFNHFYKDSFSHRKSNAIESEAVADEEILKPVVNKEKVFKTLSLSDKNLINEAPQYNQNYDNAFDNLININIDQNNNNNFLSNDITNTNNNYFSSATNNQNLIQNHNTNMINNYSPKNKNNNNNNNFNESELQENFKNLELKYSELFEDNRKLKLIFDECTETIYDAIKHYSPSLFEDQNQESENPSGGVSRPQNLLLTINNIPDSRGSVNSNYSFSTDKDLISKAVEMFKKYNKEINEKNKKFEEKVIELEMNVRTYKIMVDEYKNAWELSVRKNDKLQFDSIAAQPPIEIGELSERLKTDLANFTVEDLIEAGHVVIDERGKISARNNFEGNPQSEINLKKKISEKNVNLLKMNDFENAVNASRKVICDNRNNNDFDYNTKDDFNDEGKDKEFKSFNLGDNFLELNLDDFEKNKFDDENIFNSNTKKFNYKAYLEKFNNPAEYKILAFKKLNNDLIWYLLIPKNIQNPDSTVSNNNKLNYKTENLNKHESNFAKNTSNISDLDFMMINKIKKKSSNKLNIFSSLEKDSGRKINNNNNKDNFNLVKNYDYYMWVPGKIIANNLTNFEFEKNYSEAQTESAAPNKDKISTQNSVCEKCEKNKKQELSFNSEHLNELEKKYTSMLDEKDTEIKELVNIQEDLLKKLTDKEEKMENYKETIEMLSIQNKNNNSENNNNNNNNNNNKNNNNVNSNRISKTVPLEKYEILLNEFREEQDKGYELMKVYEELKSDYDNKAKKLFNLQNENNYNDSNNNKNDKSPNNQKLPYALDTENIQKEVMDKSFNNKTSNEIKDLNDVEVGDLLEMYNRNSLGGMNDLQELAKKLNNKNFNTVPTGGNNKSALNASSNNLNTDGNDFTLNLNKTEGYYTHDNVKEAVSEYEKNEKLLMDQLMEIKEELKQTRNERDLFRKKYNDSITLQDGKKNEILNMLRSAVEKLIIEIQITDKEQKKKSFFGFMNKK